MADCPRRKFIIDCDTGVDDAVAIFMALDAPDIDVIAITVVDGNCSLADALSNTLRVVRLAGKEVSVSSLSYIKLLTRQSSVHFAPC